MRTVAIIQARLGSTRFPRKALADLNGHPLVWHVVNRATQISGVDRVVLAVPTADYDALARAIEGLPAQTFGHAGDDADVLGRFLAVARHFEASVIGRVTGDCPVLDPVVAGEVLQLFLDSQETSQPCEFASNDTTRSGYPDGWDVEVFSRAAVETAAAKAIDLSDREHVTSFMRRNFRCVTLMAPTMRAWPKLSVDTTEDLERIRRIIRLQSELDIGLSEAVDEDARRTLLEQG